MRTRILSALLVLGAARVAYADPEPLQTPRMKERTFYNDTEAARETRPLATRGNEVGGLSATGDDYGITPPVRVRRFQLTPMLGMEMANMTANIDLRPGAILTSPTDTRNRFSFAPTYGLAADVRLGGFTIGGRYQATYFMHNDPSFANMYLGKLYLDLGFNARRGILLFSGYISGGYAHAAIASNWYNGIGGKLGINFDILIGRVFSLGPGFSFDAAGLRQSANNWVAVLGGTANLRFGFNI